MFLSLTAVCASDINETDNSITRNNENTLGSANTDDMLNAENEEDPVGSQNTQDSLNVADTDNALNAEDDAVLGEDADSQNLKKTSFKTPGYSVYIKNSKYIIKLMDENGKGISKKKIQVSFKNKTSILTTNSKGKVSFKLFSKGTSRIRFSFNETGYVPISGSKKITVVPNSTSKIKASSYVAYEGVKNPYTVTLTAGGIKLPNRNVTFKINDKVYTKITDSKGAATVNINLKKGNYRIYYSFSGGKYVDSVEGSAKISVKKGMPTKIIRINATTIEEKVSTPFKVKYVDCRGNPLVKKAVFFTMDGVKVKKLTDKNGIASFNINKFGGVYKLKVNSITNSKYIKSVKEYKIKIEPKINNGFWLFGADMKSVNLNDMAKNGINNIFLNFYAVKLYGKSAVADFATNAKSLGINVHIWMQAFYNSGWISPVDDSGKYKYTLFNSIINEAKEYAAIKGVAGIHFDYLRFAGTAYKHKNGVDAINYFTKQACDELHKFNPNLIVSAAVMPEPSGMKYYYGQDIPTISQYLDVIIPMVYKGNYNKGTAWIKSVTETFVGMSKGALVWTGLQGYYSDSDVTSIPASSLKADSKAALDGGARGIVVFRYTLFNVFDFNTLK